MRASGSDSRSASSRGISPFWKATPTAPRNSAARSGMPELIESMPNGGGLTLIGGCDGSRICAAAGAARTPHAAIMRDRRTTFIGEPPLPEAAEATPLPGGCKSALQLPPAPEQGVAEDAEGDVDPEQQRAAERDRRV